MSVETTMLRRGDAARRTRAAMRAATTTLQLSVALVAGCRERPARAARDSATSGGQPTASVVRDTGATLTGAGATFPYPLYTRWIAAYQARTGVRVNYRSVGSGEGARMLHAGEADFAATENPAADTASATVLYVPMVAGAVAVTYDLPALPRPLRLSGEIIADIWLGRITRWDDARLRTLNPGSSLPALPITVVSRTEASGTTFVVTTYLSSVSRAWSARVGVGGQVRWPTGVAERGNEGVSAAVKQTPGAIGFVELAYSQLDRLPAAAVRNASGAFVQPSAAATGAALASVTRGEPTSAELLVSLVNPPGAAAYPIVTLSWLAARRDASPAKRQALARFVRFALTDGATDATALNYSPIPSAAALAAIAHLEAWPDSARARSR